LNPGDRGGDRDRALNRLADAEGVAALAPEVVVGASAGGLATAEALRRLGFAGDITMIGAEAYLPYDRWPTAPRCRPTRS
jgi:hypothetical protein